MYFRFYGRRHICSQAKVARRRRQSAEAQRTSSLGLGYKLCALIPLAGQRTHGTTFRTLTVTSRVAATGAESAVYLSCRRGGLVVEVIVGFPRSPCLQPHAVHVVVFDQSAPTVKRVCDQSAVDVLNCHRVEYKHRQTLVSLASIH